MLILDRRQDKIEGDYSVSGTLFQVWEIRPCVPGKCWISLGPSCLETFVIYVMSRPQYRIGTVSVSTQGLVSVLHEITLCVVFHN